MSTYLSAKRRKVQKEKRYKIKPASLLWHAWTTAAASFLCFWFFTAGWDCAFFPCHGSSHTGKGRKFLKNISWKMLFLDIIYPSFNSLMLWRAEVLGHLSFGSYKANSWLFQKPVQSIFCQKRVHFWKVNDNWNFVLGLKLGGHQCKSS